MKCSIRAIVGCFMALVLVTGWSVSLAVDDDSVRYARLTSVSGDVVIIPEESTDVQTARINYPFLSGDRIMTGEDGSVEFQLDDGGIGWVWHQTKLDMTDLGYIDDTSSQITGFKLWTGSVYFRFRRPADLGSKRYVDVSDFHIVPDFQSLFRIEYNKSGVLEVGVLDGAVTILLGHETETVQAGESVEWREGFRRVELETSNVFDEWVIERDKLLGGYYGSADYIPEEFRDDVNDLNQHGKWVYNVYLSTWCWAPYVSVGWVPYRYGVWIWEPGWGWTWIPDEPWGWVPYHYGYWAFYFDLGWVWVPHWHWGPHWVAWRYTGRSVHWVPIHPRDRVDDSGRLLKGATPLNSLLKLGIPIESSLSVSEMMNRKMDNIVLSSTSRSSSSLWQGDLPDVLKYSGKSVSFPHRSENVVSENFKQSGVTHRRNPAARYNKNHRINRRTYPSTQGNKYLDYPKAGPNVYNDKSKAPQKIKPPSQSLSKGKGVNNSISPKYALPTSGSGSSAIQQKLPKPSVKRNPKGMWKQFFKNVLTGLAINQSVSHHGGLKRLSTGKSIQHK